MHFTENETERKKKIQKQNQKKLHTRCFKLTTHHLIIIIIHHASTEFIHFWQVTISQWPVELEKLKDHQK